MTLYRQLMLGVSLLFLAVLAGIVAIYLVNSRQQLQEQLGSQAQEAATSLALRLATLKSLEDRALVEALLNPMFDRGYFREIRVLSRGGETLAQRSLAPAQGEVPEWFTRLLPLEAPGAQSLVSSGWRELGRVVVVSHPNFAYQQLWHTGLQTLVWMALAYAVAIAAVIAFLGMLLRPLRDIEQEAIAIGERDFRTIAFMPRARELARVVSAMNNLSEKVRRMIAEEVERAEGLRREAFADPITGLYNRRGFERQFDSLVRSRSDVYSCALALLEINHFGEFNVKVGYQRADEVLAQLARALVQSCEGHHVVCGRLGGAGFAFATVNLGVHELNSLVSDICARIGSVLAEENIADQLDYHCGATRREAALPEFSALLASADHAVQRAREKGANQYDVEPFDEAAAAGSRAWRALVTRAIEEDRIALFAQDAFALPGRERAHSEITARMTRADGEPVPAAQFLPMAIRHGLIARLDGRVLEKLLQHMEAAAGALPQVAVNISARSIADPDAVRGIFQLLDARPALAARIVFEMTEFGALQTWKTAQGFSAEVRRRGARFALDNFGMVRESLRMVHALRPHYIKLSGAYTRELPKSEDARFFVASIVRIGRTLEIGVYAQALEDLSLVPLLEEIGFSGYQGFGVAQPARIA